MHTSEFPLAHHLQEMARQRKARADIGAYLPELPQTDAHELFERIAQAESQIIGGQLDSDDYKQGTALYCDEVRSIGKASCVLLTAEHATAQMRDDKPKASEPGIGGLLKILVEDSNASGLYMPGKQTSDTNSNEDHPIKAALLEQHHQICLSSVASVHGMVDGKVSYVTEQEPYHVIIGAGSEPTAANQSMADALVQFAQEIGLKAGVNQRLLRTDPKDVSILKLDDDNRPATIRFGAGPKTVRGFAELIGVPKALQFELAAGLRYKIDAKHDRKRLEMGVYSGYLLLKKFIELGQAV